jgi:hypothetical protein
MADRCVLTVKQTAVLALVWIGLPVACIAWLAGVIGWTSGVLYLALVTVLPSALTLMVPWVRAWLDAREEDE